MPNVSKRKNKKQKREANLDPMAITGFLLGVVSVFLGGSFSIFPILAIIFSGIGMGRTQKGSKDRLMSIVGLALGIVYILVNLYNKGYFG